MLTYIPLVYSQESVSRINEINEIVNSGTVLTASKENFAKFLTSNKGSRFFEISSIFGGNILSSCYGIPVQETFKFLKVSRNYGTSLFHHLIRF